MRGHGLSVRVRVAAVATLVGAALLVGTLVVFNLAINRNQRDALKEQGFASLAVMERSVRSGTLPDPLPVTVPTFYFLQILDADGRVLASSDVLKGLPSIAREAPPTTKPTGSVLYIDTGTFYSAKVKIADSRWGPVDLYAVAPISGIGAPTTVLWQMVLVSVAVLLLLLFPLVWWAAGRAMRPVGVIADELAAIDGRQLDRRVTDPATGDELSRLARAINASLHRLEAFVGRQQQFISDASHELRSPLTGLLARLEDAVAEPPPADEWPQVAQAALDDADRLARISHELLTLAKANAPAEHSLVDLAVLATDEADRERRVPVRVTGRPQLMVRGDPQQLRRLLTNLLDNAARHAERQVRLIVGAEDGQAVVEVIDDGAGIDPEDREKVFHRFVRLAGGRQKDAGGTGLGLPIVRSIARAHGGDVTVADSAAGARFVLRIPAA